MSSNVSDLYLTEYCVRNQSRAFSLTFFVLSKILVACDAKRPSRSDLLDASMVASELNAPCCGVVKELTIDKL